MLTRIVLIILFIVPFSGIGAQQATSTPPPDDCPSLVQKALDLTEQNCSVIGRNEVCYGHLVLNAASRPGIENFRFEEPGDIEDVITMQSLSLSAMDVVQQVWGVILMEVQAGLSVDSQENVTMVVFGDTDIRSANALFNAEVLINANAREMPEATAAIAGVVSAGDIVTVNGRTEDGDWLRVQLDPTQLTSAWIAADLLQLDGDVEDLVIIDGEGEERTVDFGPMQAFYFESGKDDAPCEEAPNSGLLVQTPEGSANVTLWIDEVIIELDANASAFVQAQPNGSLNVNLLEGTANVTAAGETQRALPGTVVSVALDENLSAAGAPTEAQAFDAEDLQSLPIGLLTRPVDVPDPLALGVGVPASGSWAFAWGVESLTCPDGTVVPFESSGQAATITASGDGSVVNWGGDFSRTAEGVYTRSYIDTEGNLYQDTLNVTSMDVIQGTSQVDFADKICTLTVPFTLTFLR